MREEISYIKRPSEPTATAYRCSHCEQIRDDKGETFGWALCLCGSFRLGLPQKAGNTYRWFALDTDRAE